MRLLWLVVDLGTWVVSPRVLEELGEAWTAELLARHQGGDWGDLDDEGQEHNEQALAVGGIILSVYDVPAGMVLIETKVDRSKAAIFFVNESPEGERGGAG